MGVAADLHVHFYPAFMADGTFEALLDRAALNLDRLWCDAGMAGKADCRLLCLTERFDCHYFKRLCSGSDLGSRWAVAAQPEPASLRLEDGAGKELIVCAGRQIVTRERLEVLALFADCNVPDGLSTAEAIAEAANQGALPVLNWAPGKWMFGRRPIVEDIIRRHEGSLLLLGDTSLRPWGWTTPELFQLGTKLGKAITLGSDPLPQRREAQLVGTFGVVSESNVSREHPGSSLRELLLAERSAFRSAGRRLAPWTVGMRIARHMFEARRTAAASSLS